MKLNRRQFLKGIGATIATAAVLGPAALAPRHGAHELTPAERDAVADVLGLRTRHWQIEKPWITGSCDSLSLWRDEIIFGSGPDEWEPGPVQLSMRVAGISPEAFESLASASSHGAPVTIRWGQWTSQAHVVGGEHSDGQVSVDFVGYGPVVPSDASLGSTVAILKPSSLTELTWTDPKTGQTLEEAMAESCCGRHAPAVPTMGELFPSLADTDKFDYPVVWGDEDTA